MWTQARRVAGDAAEGLEILLLAFLISHGSRALSAWAYERTMKQLQT
jgi:hypothetical protein